MMVATCLSVAASVARAGRRCLASVRSSHPMRTRTRRLCCSTFRRSPRKPTSSTGRRTTGATCTRTPLRRRCDSTAPTTTISAAPPCPATWRICRNRWATCDNRPTRGPRPHRLSTLRSARRRCPLRSATTTGRGPSDKSARRRLGSSGRRYSQSGASCRSTICAHPGSSTEHTAPTLQCPPWPASATSPALVARVERADFSLECFVFTPL
mmetsp:Transcript_6857/g.17098  ORF Transcript_6857/g.17098 Transcript_6857/m.17098 type:complete len:211 (+) Transcript_6857:167-799(+)